MPRRAMLARVRLPNGVVVDIYDKDTLLLILQNSENATVEVTGKRETNSSSNNMPEPEHHAHVVIVNEELPSFARENPWLDILANRKK